MRWVFKGDFREHRDKAINEMQQTLESVEQTSLPTPVLAVMMFPFFIWGLISGLINSVFQVAKGMLMSIVVFVTTPFIWLYILIDMLIVSLWFYFQIVKRMGEKE